MTPKTTPSKDVKPTKFERIYIDEETTSIWKYDLKKHPYGPVEVLVKWNKGFEPTSKKKRTLGDLVSEQKTK